MKKHSGYGPAHRVNILKKVSINGKWNLFPAVVEPNGTLKNKVRIKGQIEVHPEGSYYIEWWQGGQRKREAIQDVARVLDPARQKAIALQAAKAGMQIAEAGQNQGENPKTALAVAIQEYLRDVKPPQREPKTYAAYKSCLELFQAHLRRLTSKTSGARTFSCSSAKYTNWAVAPARPITAPTSWPSFLS